MTTRLTSGMPLPPPCQGCGAEAGANHRKDCQLLAAMRASAYPQILDDSGMEWETKLIRKLQQENERLRTELQSASNQLELLSYTSAGNDYGLSKFCAGLAGHIQSALKPNEVSDAG